MPFPYQPDSHQDPSLFSIGDPFGLRSKIIPLFRYNEETDEINGLGTAFRIDPWGTYLTAYHVLENSQTHSLYNERQLGGIFGFFSPGAVYGKVPIPKECFVPIREVATFTGIKESPFPNKADENVNIFDCAKLIFNPQNPKVTEHRKFNPLQIFGGNRPHKGDRVMAIGYPGVMDVKNHPINKDVGLTEGLYGAIGTITELIPKGRGSLYSWPTFQVSCKWPSGISGGPIYNEEGFVIGIVSSSTHDDMSDNLTEGFSFWFNPRLAMKSFLPTIDTDNNGNLLVWAVLRQEPWHLAGIFSNKTHAEKFIKAFDDEYSVVFGSNLFGTDNFVF